MTPYIESRRDEFLAAPLETITYEDKIWGVPDTSDAAFLFIRTDLIDKPPATWQEAYELAKANGGIVFQGAPYEGLTCDFLELAFAAGGEVLSEDGTSRSSTRPRTSRRSS